MDERARDIIASWERWDDARAVFKTHWQRVTNYCQPSRNDYLIERTPGAKRLQWIYDGTPVWCVEQFASGLHSRLTSPTLQWLFFHGGLERVDSDPDARAWMDYAAAAMYAIFNSPRRNFASQSNELYQDIGAIGTAVLAVTDSPKSGVLFSARHLKECCFQDNDEDHTDSLIRSWKWTAKQAMQMWGAKCGEKIAKAAADKPETEFRFLQAVRPRKERNPDRSDALHMGFESLYVSECDGAIISESGFQEFPYGVLRFQKLTGEIYGRGPGMTALPDIQMLNELMKLVLKAAQKKIDPPLQLPDATFIVPVRQVPGSLNYYRAGSRPTDRIEPIQTGGDIELGANFLEQVRAQIARVFYVDLLRMPIDMDDPSSEGKGSTATYWMQRQQKEMMALSPMLARVQSDLEPVIERVFNILWRKSAALKFGPGSPFPPPPASLSGAKLEVEFVSPIAMAQRSTQMDAIQQALALQGQLRQIDPASPIYLDFEAISRITNRDTNAPAAILKTPQRVQQEAQQKAEADQAMQQHMALQNVAGAAKDGTAAVKNMADANDTMQEAA
jgi:hypothetical protein